jgi:uncharacterized membrane protein YvlD (DUF360 family)
MDRNLAQVSKFRKIALYSVLGLLAASVFRLLLGLLPEPPGIVFGLVITLLMFGFLVTVIISLVLWIAALIANQAALKGRNWQSFFILSIFFPFIMWIVVSVMTTDQSQPISGTKKCPKCAEYVKAEATLCKHCGSSI